MMNVAPARNCVSTSHLAAATCHYCTITVCTTIVCDAHKLRRDSVRRFSFPIFAISRVHSEGGVGGAGELAEIRLDLVQVGDCRN